MPWCPKVYKNAKKLEETPTLTEIDSFEKAVVYAPLVTELLEECQSATTDLIRHYFSAKALLGYQAQKGLQTIHAARYF